MINFPITVVDNGTVVGTFYVGCVKSAVQNPNQSLYHYVQTDRPSNSGLKSIWASLTPTAGTWSRFCDLYVGTSANLDNRLGFQMRVWRYQSGNDYVYHAQWRDKETRTFFYTYLPKYNDTNRDFYLCLPYLGEDLFSDANITNMTQLKTELAKFRTRYLSREHRVWTFGMSGIDTAPLVGIMHDGTRSEGQTERPMNDLDYDHQDTRGFYHNLNTYWNWHHFITGQFYFPVQYVYTEDEKKIYLSAALSFEGDDHLYSDGNTADRQFFAEADNMAPPFYAYDYQSGTDLRSLIDNIGDTKMLSNGSVIRCKQAIDAYNSGRYYYYYEIVNSTTGETVQLTSAFNARISVGDLVSTNYTGSFLDGELYQRATSRNDLFLQHVGFWQSPYEEAGIATYINENEGKPAAFWNQFPTTPLTISGVYTSVWSGTNEKYSSWEARAAAWQKLNVLAPLMISNQAGYVDPVNQGAGYLDFVNLFSNINLPDTSQANISAIIHNNGGKIVIDDADGARRLWGISDAIDPDPPSTGGGSIGGGGGHSGGGGQFNDTGDNVGFSTGSSFGVSNTITNWHLGDLGSSELDTNLDLMGNWLRTTADPDAQNPLAGLGYKYSDKLANICSLKVIYAPSGPTLSGPLVPKIHGQVLHGTGDANPSAEKVTNQFKQTGIKYNFKLEEYFGSFLDYAPYTKIMIYLPFAGVHELDPSDIVGKDVTIFATVDFITGDIVYNIRVNTETCNSVLYTFSGNASIDLPLTATDYSGKIASGIQTILGAATLAAGVAGAAHTGGMSLAAAGSAASSVAMGAASFMSEGRKVYTKGAVGGSVGAMSPMQCYLIVTRPKMVQADDYGPTYGYPSGLSIALSRITGYVKVAECHWAIPGATEEELDELDRVMKNEGAIL